jgi:GTP diphosphokinase / guanosine-3',5'-bis(diphosphate) 3'-diphosphatase
VVVLPKDASPLDFAYSIHTEVGHSCTGAKVNGRLVPLRSKLRNGDIVEVITQNGHTPSRDWLTFVKSSRARNKIKHWLNEHQRERAIDIGRKLLEREARKYKVSLSKFEDSDYARVAADYSVATPSDLMAAIGFGKYSARQVLNRLSPGVIHQQPAEAESAAIKAGAAETKRSAGGDSLQVEGQNELLVYRARCCNPIRGEEIIGYVTRGKGVAVHARNCSNVQNLLYESDRRISVEWAREAEEKAGRAKTYPVRLTIYCDDRPGMLKEMTATISDENTNIRTVDSRSGPNGEAIVEFVIEAQDVRHLNRLVQGLRRLVGVRDVQRSQRL